MTSAHLPTSAEVCIGQLVVSESHAGDGAVATDEHVEYDPRSYAFSLLFNAVVFIKWNSYFTKYNLGKNDCLSVCLSVYLRKYNLGMDDCLSSHLYLSVYLSICLYIHISIYLSVYLKE